MDSFSVPLESRRRARVQLVQKLQHVLPSVFLLVDGVGRLGGERSLWSIALGSAEVASSVLVIGAFARAIRAAQRGAGRVAAQDHARHGVDWLDLFLGGMLVIEAFVHRQETGHLPRPTLLLAAVVFTLGLLHGRLHARVQRRQALRVTAAGISIPLRLRRRLEVSWGEISDIKLTPTEARIVTRRGVERRIDLADLTNSAAIVDALTIAQERLTRHHAGRLVGRGPTAPPTAQSP